MSRMLREFVAFVGWREGLFWRGAQQPRSFSDGSRVAPRSSERLGEALRFK